MLDVVRTGRVGVATLLLWLAVALAALSPAAEVRIGVRAAADLVARLFFLPPRGWSAAVVALDAVLVAGAWYAAGRARRGGGTR
ncbi:hypothetical protein GCM10027258_87330 [Amycolatopsis stemonae]